MFSKIVLDEELLFAKRFKLFALTWLIPIVGVVVVYKTLELNWFRNEDGSKGGGMTTTSFLEMDAIFNPGSRHVLEEKQREKMQTRKDGEGYEKPEQ
jgi:hypothetical protein